MGRYVGDIPRRKTVVATGIIWQRAAYNFPIAAPRLVKEPPTGPDWLHEVKFEGFRPQAHKLGAGVGLFSKNGKDLPTAFPRFRGRPATTSNGCRY